MAIPIPITIPRLGWNMEEGVFVGWLKPDGAHVRAGESLFSLESDKATEEVECLDEGILRIPPDGPRDGDRVAVGAVIGYVARIGEAVPIVSAAPGEQRQSPGSATHTAPPAPRSYSPTRERLTVSPRARRVARELGVDPTGLHGTGRNGRIRERDVRAAVLEHNLSPTDTLLPVTSIRRTIAERMLASRRCTAPVTLTTTADATNLVSLRNQFKASTPPANDSPPTYTDFFVKLAAVALQRHPMLNARWDNDGLRVSARINIGFAVDTDAGLFVPVHQDVASLDLTELAARARALLERARQSKLTAKDLQGGTFTVTNLGAFGIDAFTPLINYPQCAILGVGRIQRRATVIGDQVVGRDQVALSLTFDHRIVDGAPAARFLQTLSGLIEDPGPWLTSAPISQTGNS